MPEGSRFTPIELPEIQAVLRVEKGWTQSIIGNEIVFDFPIKSTGLILRVFSSIKTDGVCRGLGDDAIRICVPRRMKSVRVYRTPNWRTNLQKRAEETFHKYRSSQ